MQGDKYRDFSYQIQTNLLWVKDLALHGPVNGKLTDLHPKLYGRVTSTITLKDTDALIVKRAIIRLFAFLAPSISLQPSVSVWHTSNLNLAGCINNGIAAHCGTKRQCQKSVQAVGDIVILKVTKQTKWYVGIVRRSAFFNILTVLKPEHHDVKVIRPERVYIPNVQD